MGRWEAELVKALCRRRKLSKAVSKTRDVRTEKLRRQARLLQRGQPTPRKARRLQLNHPTRRTISDVEVWKKAVLAEKRNPALFNDDRNAVLEVLRRELRLADQFPIGQMANLWIESSWRTTLTRWSETAIGRDNFDILKFSHMLSLRADKFWLGCMESVLNTLDALPHNLGRRIEIEDWNALMREMPGLNKKEQTSFFFPRQVVGHEQSTLQRRPQFLPSFDNKEYMAILNHLQTDELLQFSDVQWLLQTTSEEATTMARVLEHVVDWFDETSSSTRQQQGNMNAQICDGLRPVLERFYECEELSASRFKDEIERHSQEIESSVMGSVRQNINFFQSSYGQETLRRRLEDDRAEYCIRFTEPAWGTVLSVVEDLFLKVCPCPWRGNFGETGIRTRVGKMRQEVQKFIPEVMGRFFDVNEPQRRRAKVQGLVGSVDELIRQWVKRMEDGEDGEDEVSKEIPETVRAENVVGVSSGQKTIDDRKKVSAQAAAPVQDTRQSILGVEALWGTGSAPPLPIETSEEKQTQLAQPRIAHQEVQLPFQQHGPNQQQIACAVQPSEGPASCRQDSVQQRWHQTPPQPLQQLPHSYQQGTVDQQGWRQLQPAQRGQSCPQIWASTPQQTAFLRQQQINRFWLWYRYVD